MQVKGKIIVADPIREGVGKRSGMPYKVQNFVLQTLDQYERKIPFDVFGEEDLNKFKIQLGEILTIHIDIDSKVFQGRYYPRILCNKVDRDNADNGQAPGATVKADTGNVPMPPNPFPPSQPKEKDQANSSDDLPFDWRGQDNA